jgi:hypothetical protein
VPPKERRKRRDAPVAADKKSLSHFCGPPDLVRVRPSEEVVEPQPLLDRRAQRVRAEDENRREARIALVEAGLQEESAAADRAAVIRGDGHAVEVEKM